MLRCPRCDAPLHGRPSLCVGCGLVLARGEAEGAKGGVSLERKRPRRLAQAAESGADLPAPSARGAIVGPALVVGEIELPPLPSRSRERKAAPAAARRPRGRSAPLVQGHALALALGIAGALAVSLVAVWWTRPPAAAAVTGTAVDVAALLDADTPTSYHAALIACEDAGDRLCAAEAALLLDLRYGPDPVRASVAQTLADGAGDDDTGRRLRGLARLTRGDLDGAAALLTGDDPRSALYRGLLAERRGDRLAANEAAREALRRAPQSVAAVELDLSSRTDDRTPALTERVRIAEHHPDHPRLQLALARSLIAAGELIAAEVALAGLRDEPRASPSFRAERALVQAALAESHGRRRAALERYDEALRLAPERRDAQHRRLRLLLDLGALARLRHELDVFLRAAPDDVDARAIELALDIRLGRLERVDARLAELAALEGDGPRAPTLAGRLHLARGDEDEALASFQEAREADPGDVEATIAEANLRAGLGQRSEAIAILDAARRAAREQGQLEAARDLLAAQLDLLTVRPEALSLLDAAIADDPGDLRAQVRGAELRLALGQQGPSHRALVALHERCGDLPGLVDTLARFYLDTGDTGRAAALVEAAAASPDADDDVLLVAAEVRLRRGDVAGARARIDRVLLRNPGSARGQLLRAELLFREGALAEAERALAGLDGAGPSADVELLRGRILAAAGDGDGALLHLRRARHLADRPEHTAAYAEALLQRGEAAAARSELAAKVAATSPPAALVRLDARALAALGDRELALANLAALLARDPRDGETLYWRGRILLDGGDVDEAALTLQAALDAARGDEAWLPAARAALHGARG